MNCEITVCKVGSGQIVDEKTGQVTDWAKIYGIDPIFSNDDMFTGFKEVNYSIVDPQTGRASVAIANQIKQKLISLSPKSPQTLLFEIQTVSAGKRATIAVTGFAKQTAVTKI